MKRIAIVFALLAGWAATPAVAQYTLASFNGANGASPTAGVILSGGTLYGTTAAGGDSNNDGVVFSVPAAGGTPTVLTAFTGDFGNGSEPYAGVILSGGTLYGTTEAGGGTHGAGEVFSEPIGGGAPTVLTSFNNNTNGPETPLGGVILSGSSLYGTTVSGGANGYGTVFSEPIGGGAPTVLASFNDTNGAGNPQAGLILSGSTLYGTTFDDEVSNGGAVFSVPVGGGTPTVLATFNGTDGFDPQAGLILSGGTLYGTTWGGGANNEGEVFSVPVTGGTPTVLASFNGANMSHPQAGLTLFGNTLYGTTSDQAGGINFSSTGDGEVFSVPITGGTPTVLASFNGANGDEPYGGLILSGNTLYGTTLGGGANGDGVVFSLTVPEPTTASLLGLASMGLLARRRRCG